MLRNAYTCTRTCCTCTHIICVHVLHMHMHMYVQHAPAVAMRLDHAMRVVHGHEDERTIAELARGLLTEKVKGHDILCKLLSNLEEHCGFDIVDRVVRECVSSELEDVRECQQRQGSRNGLFIRALDLCNIYR